MKIAIIGGGSYLWTLGFIKQFARSKHFSGSHVALMDIDADALALVGRAAEIVNSAQGEPLRLSRTMDLSVALSGADFVIVSITTGGLDAMAVDLEIPEKHGVWHTVGDTVGPGGWLRAMRNVPVFYEIAETMSRVCPAAWMLNVTNPLTVLTRVPAKCFGIKVVGMCPSVEETIPMLAELAGADAKARKDYVVSGINHGSFFTQLKVDGMDVLAKLKEKGYCRADGVLPTEVSAPDSHMGASSMRAAFAVWHELGYLPSIADRHIVENYPWFVANADGQLDFGLKRTSIADRRKRRENSRQRLVKFNEAPDEAAVKNLGHGDDPVGLVIEALSGHGTLMFGANYRNIGQTPQAPVDAVVESRCLFDSAGVHPQMSPMPGIVGAVVLPTILRQEMVIEIALTGKFDDLVALVNTDPLCSRMKFGECRKMVGEMVRGLKGVKGVKGMTRFSA